MNSGTRNYAIVTAAYWGFTLSDGALRMLVLLHFYRLGYSPFTLAFLFLLYEAMGIVANLVGGWLATRYGIARMLAGNLARAFGWGRDMLAVSRKGGTMVRCDLSTAPIWAIRCTRCRLAAPDTTTRKREEGPHARPVPSPWSRR